MQNPLKKVGLILFLLAVGAGCSLFAQDVAETRQYQRIYYAGDLGDIESTATQLKAFLSKNYPGIEVVAYYPNNSLVIKAHDNVHDIISELMRLIRSFRPEAPCAEEKEEPIMRTTGDGTPVPCFAVIQLENVMAEEVYQTILAVLPEANAGDQTLRLAVDHNSNSLVMLSAYPEFTPVIEGLVKKLDVPRKEVGRPRQELTQERQVSVYTLHNRLAQEVVGALQPFVTHNVAHVRFDNHSNSVIVFALPDTQEEIAKTIVQFDQPPKQVLPVVPQRVPVQYMAPVPQQQYYNPLPSQIPNMYQVP